MSIKKPWAIGLLSFLTLILLILAFMWFSDWAFLRGPLERYLGEKLGRPVSMSDFRMKLRPVTQIRVANLKIGGDKNGGPDLVSLEKLEGGVRLMSVINQPVIIEVLRLEGGEAHLARDAEGKGNWSLAQSEPSGEKRPVPQVRQLALDRATVHYDDRKLDLKVNITGNTIKREDPTSASGRYGVHFAFDGDYKKGKFNGEARTAGLMDLVQNTNQTVPMQISVNSGTTKLFFEGSMGDVVKLDKIDAALKVSGATLANLYPFLPLPLPASPPYALNAQLQRDGKNWRLLGINGTIGRSDMAGDASYTLQEPRPMLDVKLKSRELHFADLGPLVGLEVRQQLDKQGQRVNTRADAQKARAATGRAGKVLPDSDFSLEKLNAMDADVQLDAGKIDMDRPFAFESLSVTLKLREGVMDLAPVRFGFAGGTLDGTIRLDATKNPIAARANIAVQKARIARLFPTNKLLSQSSGLVGVNAKLEGRGNSVAALLASANGNLGLASTGGEISNLLVELVGLDAGQALGYWLGRDKPTPLRCAVTTFRMERGVAVSELLVLDTVDTMIDGEGVANFRDETLDFTFRPHPKDKSILAARSPLHIRGSFGKPSPSVDAKALAARGGAAALLGLVVTPLAALIPLIEPGTGTDADCQGLLKTVEPARKNANGR
ncbi:AsmA family protein [Pigmentiphaga aceris]|uniref:AsmA family protein n=1 Tax=Pigmentiphaga aceris TaxID=1940612 RepID=A0A5C0AWX4_9BURK|nr:AsmA family protein [Pigmentiphaga aceris]QEI05330.1 AsmA family protein [Pigmentiphaga aceris]